MCSDMGCPAIVTTQGRNPVRSDLSKLRQSSYNIIHTCLSVSHIHNNHLARYFSSQTARPRTVMININVPSISSALPVY